MQNIVITCQFEAPFLSAFVLKPHNSIMSKPCYGFLLTFRYVLTLLLLYAA